MRHCIFLMIENNEISQTECKSALTRARIIAVLFIFFHSAFSCISQQLNVSVEVKEKSEFYQMKIKLENVSNSKLMISDLRQMADPINTCLLDTQIIDCISEFCSYSGYVIDDGSLKVKHLKPKSVRSFKRRVIRCKEPGKLLIIIRAFNLEQSKGFVYVYDILGDTSVKILEKEISEFYFWPDDFARVHSRVTN